MLLGPNRLDLFEDGGQGRALNLHQTSDTGQGQIEHPVELVAAEAAALAGLLDLDAPETAATWPITGQRGSSPSRKSLPRAWTAAT